VVEQLNVGKHNLNQLPNLCRASKQSLRQRSCVGGGPRRRGERRAKRANAGSFASARAGAEITLHAFFNPTQTAVILRRENNVKVPA
jgi:hypothetical protein